MAGTAVIKRKKKQKKEEIILRKILDDTWEVYHELGLFVSGGVKNAHKVMGEVIKRLYKLGKELEEARNFDLRLKENEIVRLLNFAYKELQKSHGRCWDILRGKGDFKQEILESRAEIEKAFRAIEEAIQYQERRIKEAA